MPISFWPALRARWNKTQYGSVYSGPLADIATDNGFQDAVKDPNGVAVNAIQLAGTSRGRLNLNNANGVSVNGALSTAAAPTVTPTGGSASTWAYKIVARMSNATAAASSAGQTTTGGATLSGTVYNTVTWAAVAGATSYDVYRTTSASSPSTTGYVANILASSSTSGTYTYVDTGDAGDSRTAPTANTTSALEAPKCFDISVIGLAAVQSTTITNGGTVGSTAYSYSVSAVTAAGTENGTAAAASTATGNATLDSTNYNIITWAPVPGAISYNVYRTASAGTPATTGLIANVVATTSATTVTTNDTGLTASGSVVTTDTTGSITAAGTSTFTSLKLSKILDTNGNPEMLFTATASAVNGVVLTNSATGNPVTLIPGASSGSDTNIGFTIQSKGTGALRLEPAAAGGTVVVGKTDQTGDIVIGSSSATQSVKIADGVGAKTVTIGGNNTTGTTVTVAAAATANGITDTLNIATGNAASGGIKVVNIATGVPVTSGNNRVTLGGGSTTKVTTNATNTSYRATNFVTAAGSNNAITVTLTDAGGSNITQAAGLEMHILLANSLQAGANTIALNGAGAANLKSSRNPANNIATAYVSGGVIHVIFDGTQYLDLSQ